MKNLIITRQQLFDMVWADSLSSIVKKYQLTYTELRKILHLLKIGQKNVEILIMK
jgi:DNA-binding winged helix-turn-helix (wHTH) protein